MDLKGKTVLITGASQGIGAECARHFARAGAGVALVARSLDKLERLRDALREGGARAVAIQGDVTKSVEVEAAIGRTRAAIGPVDILIANAGIAESSSFVKTSDELWDRTLATNLNGTFYAMRGVLPDMIERGWGRIICIASDAGRVGFPYTAAYCASKHGVVGLMRALAQEVARKGITVNAICPGFVDTPMAEAAVERIERRTDRSAADARAYLESLSPQGRIFEAEEVAAMAIFLASEEARGVHGQAIPLDGGAVQA